MKCSFFYYLSKLIKKIINIPSIKGGNINKTSKICSGSHVVNCNIDRYSYIGNYCTVINADIGSFCSIADNCKIGVANHPLDWVSTSPVFHAGKNTLKKNFSEHAFKPTSRTIIGNDVWIGANCILKSGITVGHGAIIGAGAVVTNNIEPYSIVGGVPAKEIRKRFSEEHVEKLLDIKWWEWDEEKLLENSYSINNVDQFIVNNFGE